MKLKSKSLYYLAFLVTVTVIFLSGCQKWTDPVSENQKNQVSTFQANKFEKPSKRVNPFSHENIKKAKKKLPQQNSPISVSNRVDEDRLYSYIRFNPNTVSGQILQQLEADTTIRILNFPFADGELYGDDFALDENKANQLADGNLYIVVKKNTAIEATIRNSSALSPLVIDELYLPDETDTTLQFQAFREAGYTEEQISQLRICLLKRPSGFVRYTDQETGRLVNVPGMQVWGLVFGIPVHTYTDATGYYRLPWRFVAGTIMGTHAKNGRVNIKPLNTQGAWWSTIPVQFIVGSLYIHGWVGACQMNNDVNIEFKTHRQNRYWAQLMHAVSLHDGYCVSDGINNAPDRLIMYAHWDDNYGSASAPMLGHISTTPTSLILQYFTGLLNGTNPNNYPNLFNILTGLMPDITIKTGSTERPSYSARLMQTAFHELGHGSHFRRAGQSYWIDFIRATLRNHPEDQCGGGYGCGQNPDDGNVAIGESWAEFIGTNHAQRNHLNGLKNSRWQSLTTTGDWNILSLISFTVSLEREPWFFNTWIASGIYNDLMDVANTWPLEDAWDRTGGLSIQQLYMALGPNIDFYCDYEWEIITRYGLSIVDVDEIFVNNGAGGCL